MAHLPEWMDSGGLQGSRIGLATGSESRENRIRQGLHLRQTSLEVLPHLGDLRLFEPAGHLRHVHPLVEERGCHLKVELESEPGTEPEGLDLGVSGACQELCLGRQGDLVTMPMKDIGALAPHGNVIVIPHPAYGGHAMLRLLVFDQVASQGPGQNLMTQAYPQEGLVGTDRGPGEFGLRLEPGVVFVIIGRHGSPHDDHTRKVFEVGQFGLLLINDVENPRLQPAVLQIFKNATRPFPIHMLQYKHTWFSHDSILAHLPTGSLQPFRPTGQEVLPAGLNQVFERVRQGVRETLHRSTSLDRLWLMDKSSHPQNDKHSVSLAAADLRLYDTATHQVTPFHPIEEGRVGIYVCGATVQSSPHIGHIRTTLAFDLIRRWLMRLGYQVTLVRNVTDIDDKILDKASAAGQRWWERAYIYEREFSRAYEALGALPPTYEPRATGHITDMIDLVQRIIDRGHAYVVPDAEGNPSGNVYFDVPSWPDYGELTHQQTGTQAADEQAAIADRMGPSVDADGQDDPYNPADQGEAGKRNPRDFALWKAPKPTDPSTARWKTPFGTGRPGWHLECSAMSHRYLGADFDIHGGGLDLRFPHHENEMAQSHAAGWGFAHRWMHTAWVTQKGEKMSKSLGNGLSVDQVLSAYPAWVVRYALISVQYRSMLEWSDQTLHEAQGAYGRITNFIERAGAILGGQPSRGQVETLGADGLPADFTRAMNEDINASAALAAIFSTIRSANSSMDDLDRNRSTAGPERDQALEDLRGTLLQVRAMLDVFGLDPLADQWSDQAGPNRDDEPMQQALDALIRTRLDQRAEARKAKDFNQADQIRNELEEAGIAIVDTPDGPTWHLNQ